jgi:hypothetical protein
VRVAVAAGLVKGEFAAIGELLDSGGDTGAVGAVEAERE